MGSVPNVGLMTLKAEEYESRSMTFEAPSDGKVKVAMESGDVLMERSVETGDIWRACQTKDIATQGLGQAGGRPCQGLWMACRLLAGLGPCSCCSTHRVKCLEKAWHQTPECV